MREIVRKQYDRYKRVFVVEYYDSETDVAEHKEFETIEAFTAELGAEIDGADITEYKMDSAVRDYFTSKGAIVSRGDSRLPRVFVGENSTSLDFRVYYVTDIHLDVKLRLEYGDDYLVKTREVMPIKVREILDSMDHVGGSGPSIGNILLIGGDVAHDFEISKLFYTEVSRQTTEYTSAKVFAIMGNHEFWEIPTEGEGSDPDECVARYTDMLSGLGITLLHNSIASYHLKTGWEVIGEEDLLILNDDEIRQKMQDCLVIVFGTPGFSALEPVLNAESGMYRHGIRDLKEETIQSARANTVYCKLKSAIPSQSVVVLSHMPIHSWTTAGYHSGWTYVHGHDHHNVVSFHGEAVEYANNQFGYGRTGKLKYFLVSGMSDIYRYWEDGIYEISKQDYLTFISLMGMDIYSLKGSGKIKMLKRDGLYMFFYDYGDSRGIRRLDGGLKRKVDHDINYYYENMAHYGENIRRFATIFQSQLESISDVVKRFGGDGRIHGCIVDISFTAHLYLNLYDGTLTPYSAYSMTDKILYPTVEMLLEHSCPDLLGDYRALLDNGDTGFPATSVSVKVPLREESTEIYRVSREMYRIQHMLNHNVIRQWNDDLLDLDDYESGKRAVIALIG